VCSGIIVPLKGRNGLSDELGLGVLSIAGSLSRSMAYEPWRRQTAVCANRFGSSLISSGMA
jgi:hypothetical protein